MALVGDIRKRFEDTGAVPEPAKPDAKTEKLPKTQEPAAEAPAKPEKPVVPAPKPNKVPAKTPAKAAAAQRAPQETIRVSAPLLDELVNLAGETSITRGRLEQQTSDFSHNLDEMAATIERLREKLAAVEVRRPLFSVCRAARAMIEPGRRRAARA